MTNRSYSLLEVRSVDDEKRIIEGIATTPSVARDGDVIETRGIQFKLPIPFLYRHKDPFGNVESANVSDQGISVRIQVAPAGVSASIDEQWRLVRAGIVRGLSIGWRTLKEEFDKTINGFRITSSEWLELSAVPVPADTNATITSVRSADEAILAALGRGNGLSNGRTKQQPPGVSGSRRTGDEMPKKIEDQIASFEASREDIQTRMAAIMDKYADDGKITDSNDQRDYDALMVEGESTDRDLKRALAMKRMMETAQPIPEVPGQEREAPRVIRPRVEVTQDESAKLPKGTGFARAVICKVRAHLDHENAVNLARRHYPETPGVAEYLKARAYVEAGDTTTSGWASQLVPAAQQLQGEFLELLRAASIIGRIPGLRRVPFNISVPLQTGGGTYQWVGESANKPVTSHTYDSVTLRWAKAAGITVISQELARFSSPAAEEQIRSSMIADCTAFLDAQFIDPNVAAVTNVSPGSILNGISSTPSTGTSAGAFRYDMNVMLTAFAVANRDLSKAVILMSASTAMALGAMINSLGQPEFPTVNMGGGSYLGIPIVTSQAVGNKVILLDASEILLADDGNVSIAISDQATIEMSSTPLAQETSPPTTGGVIYHNMFQRNELAIRAERFITWLRARSTAVKWITLASYGPAQTSP